MEPRNATANRGTWTMADSSPDGTADQTSGNNHASAADELVELRRLLLGPEQTQLGKLQEQVDYITAGGLKPPAEDVGAVLPQAVVLRSNQDQQLTIALRPTVEEALQASVKRDPQPLVDALSPAMGPAIRKAISYALNGM